MTFMALTIQKSNLLTQKTQLEFQQLVATNDYNFVTSQLTVLASDDNTDMNSPAVRQLEYYQEMYSTNKESIDSQLKVINTEIDSFQKAVDGNIKNECKLSISV